MKKISSGLITRFRIKQWKTGFFILFLVFQMGNVFASGIKRDADKRDADKIDTLVFENQYQFNKYMLDNKQFVLQANYLQNQYGVRRFVSSSINFVKVDSTTAVIQIGSNYRLGVNGVGGVTAKGKITSWKLSEDPKSESFTLFINVMTSIGIYDLMFNIYSNGHSTALLTGLTAGQLTFDGDIVPISESSVYEGTSF